jgi:hypothetical protein
VRDALYHSLLSETRIALHLRIAEELESRSGNRLGEVVEVLAHHYSQTERVDKAVSYLAMAGRKSLDVYSLDEANNYFAAAVALLDRNLDCAGDQQTAELLADYTRCLNMLFRLKSLIETIERFKARLDRLGDSPIRIPIQHHYVPDILVSEYGLSGSSGRALQLYLNNGDGTFTDATANIPGSIVNDGKTPIWFQTIAAIDVNGDGKLDIVVESLNASGQPTPADTPVMWINDGTGHFTALDYQDLGLPSYPANLFPVNQNGGAATDFLEVGEGGQTNLLVPSSVSSGSLESLTPAQEIAGIYVGYFGRAPDPDGFEFWKDQFTQALSNGQSTDQALQNIANSFAPQPETIALYPFLAAPFHRHSPTELSQVENLVVSIYGNLFDRTPAQTDSGVEYWAHEVLKGLVPLGQAILDIANGALGVDSSTILNKITVADYFESAYAKAGLAFSALPAHSIIMGVTADPTSVNSAEVAIDALVSVTGVAPPPH